MTRTLRIGLVLLAVIVAAVATWLWIRSFDVSSAEISLLFTTMVWWPVPLLFILLVVHVTLASWRWSLIDRGLGGGQRKLRENVAVGAFALGLGTFLPAPLVNILGRSLANKVSGTSALRGAISGGIDQVADFVAVLLLAGPAALAIVLGEPKWYFTLAPLTLSAPLGLVWAGPAISRQLSRVDWPISKSLSRLLADPSLLLTVYGISVLRVGGVILMNLAIHFASGAGSTLAIVVGVPLVMLATSVAMMPGSFGVSEWSFSAVLAAFGTPPGQIVLFVLANRILFTGLSLAFAIAMIPLASGGQRSPSNRQGEVAATPSD